MKDQETGADDVERLPVDRSLAQIEHTLDRFLAVADVGKVFSEPIREGETTIIPAAEVMTGMGFGHGFGRGSDAQGEEEHRGGGGGGGGGGSAWARPVAVVVATPQGVRVEPVIDFTKVALAAVTAGGFMLATWLGMRKPKKPRL